MRYIARFFVIMTFLLTSHLYASIGKVSLLKGEAFVQRGADKLSLQNGTNLEEQDVITTSKNTQIQLIFEDKTVITLGGDSRFKIKEYFNDAVEPKAKFKFEKGAFKSITGQIGKIAPENFILETKTATIGIRGTIMAGTVDMGPLIQNPPTPQGNPDNDVPPQGGSAGDSIFCLSGASAVSSNGSQVLLNAGQKTSTFAGTGPTAPSPITSADLAGLYQGLGAGPDSGSGPGPGAGGGGAGASTSQAGFTKTPELLSSVEQSHSEDTTYQNLQNLATTRSLTGFGTSMYYLDGQQYSIGDTVNLILANESVASGTISLSREPSPEPLTMNANTLNISTVDPNSDYLYWGTWTSMQMDSGSTLQASNDNNWVAGTKAVSAANYITTLQNDITRTPILTYTGNVIGNTYDSNGLSSSILIDTYNKVLLQFNLGTSNPIDETNSLITFSSNGDFWSLKLISSYLENGLFSASFNSVNSSVNEVNNVSGSLSGMFYGPSANAAGGVFQALDYYGNTALGVFKTIKESSFYYPENFTPSLATETNPAGSVNFTGFATSEYILSGVHYTSSSDTLSLDFDNLLTYGTISLAGRNDQFSLYREIEDDNTLTYIDRNNFVIKDFDAGKGWMQTDSTNYTNDYVSWGYWAVNSTDNSQLTNNINYWVGGDEANASLAAEHIAALITNTQITTSYTYNGHSIGYVQDATTQARDMIDPTTNNAVVLNFDFGGGAGSLKNTSYIKFQTTDTQKVWQINPSGLIPTDGTQFSVTNANTLKVNDIIQNSSTSVVNGKFYGDVAQAIGGTFNAATSTATAVGVFKAVR